MNEHAGWSPEGICVQCGSESGIGACDPDGLWQRFISQRRRMLALEEAVIGMLKHEPWPPSERSQQDFLRAQDVLLGVIDED